MELWESGDARGHKFGEQRQGPVQGCAEDEGATPDFLMHAYPPIYKPTQGIHTDRQADRHTQTNSQLPRNRAPDAHGSLSMHRAL